MSAAGSALNPAPVMMPVPFGVNAATGEPRPPLTEEDLDRITGDHAEVKARAKTDKTYALVPTMDAKNLADAGWGIVFPSNIDPAIKKALEPLIEHRRKEATGPQRFKVYEGNNGVKPDQSATDWLDRQGVGLAVVDPDNGVPYYLTLVGSPKQISYEFQYVLDLQWCVGRLYFESPAEYEAYARFVVDYETASSVPTKKHAVMWMPQNPGDAATAMLSNQVGYGIATKGLGTTNGYKSTSFMEAQATKAQLRDILTGKLPDGPPALLFTGSHGLEWPMSDPAGQKAYQGALITQEWTPGQKPTPACMFSGYDLPPEAKVQGMVLFVFACFGGGCPTTDTYRSGPAGAPIVIAPEPLAAKLPQALLSKGALAVIAHVDRAWSWSFQTGSGLPQSQVMRSTMDAVLMGLRFGMALDFYNLQWSTLAARLEMLQNQPKATPASLLNLFIARDDARNYVLFGDPAARLRTADMTA